jgi:predicted enzyme related to lactoylglutathione lyase
VSTFEHTTIGYGNGIRMTQGGCSIRIYLGAVVIDVNDLEAMRAFWEEALAYEAAVEHDDWIKLSPPLGGGPNVSLQLVPEPREGKNRLHLDLYSDAPTEEIKRLEELGASVVNAPANGDFTVLADPEGNLFCVIDRSGNEPD